VQDRLKEGDPYFDVIKNKFCPRIIDILGEIALSMCSVEKVYDNK